MKTGTIILSIATASFALALQALGSQACEVIHAPSKHQRTDEILEKVARISILIREVGVYWYGYLARYLDAPVELALGDFINGGISADVLTKRLTLVVNGAICEAESTTQEEHKSEGVLQRLKVILEKINRKIPQTAPAVSKELRLDLKAAAPMPLIVLPEEITEKNAKYDLASNLLSSLLSTSSDEEITALSTKTGREMRWQRRHRS